MSTRLLGRLALVLALLPLVQCTCRENPINKVDPCKDVTGVQANHFSACAESTECEDHHVCAAIKDHEGLSCCVKSDRKCNTEADCCPGQTCPADRKRCFDKFISCEKDADCGDKGDRFCETWTDSYGTSSRCRFKTCSSLGACPEGQACFNGECMVDPPCGGACDPGKACVPSGGPEGRCQDFVCPASCAPGFIATFKDARDIWDTCSLPSVTCQCAELPPLKSNDVGRYSAIAADALHSELLVSAYDGEYGDLVVSRYEASGALAKRVYVDGVPASGMVKYGPSGVRNGIVDPGDDMGRYSDIAVRGPNAFVSYYDATHGDLRLAVRDPSDQTWKTFRVDGATADVGLFTSIAIDPDGLVGISYFQQGGDASFDVASCPGVAPTGDKAFITALKFARSTTPTPAAATDFAIKTVACQSRPPPPCAACGAQLCADPGTGAACYATATGCPACAAGEACVRVGTVNRCTKTVTPQSLIEIPDGVGLFSSLAFKGKDAFIAYMKRVGKTGDLYGVRLTGGTTVTTPVLLDGVGDTGYFADLVVDPTSGALQIAYHDFTSRQLRFYSSATLSSLVTPEVIDKGLGAPDSGDVRWAGTDVALVRSPAGRLFAVYQDATAGDLKLSARGTGWEALPPVRTDGAVGFFADGVFLGDQLFASHARLHAKQVGGEPKVDNSLLIEKVPSP